MTASLPALWPAASAIGLACAAMGLLMIGVFRGDREWRLVAQLAIVALAIAFILLFAGADFGTVRTFNGQFIADAFGRFMKGLVLVGTIFAIVLSQGYLDREKAGRPEFPVLMVLAALGMLLMVSANDLISLYLGLELQSLSLYIVAAFRRDTLRSTEAGLKYFVLGALSSGMLLYGCSLVYGFAGTTAFDGLTKLFAAGGTPPIGVVVGIVFVVSGLAFKISAVPFHMWTPDVYEGAPTPVTAFFAAAPKVAAMALFVRVMVGPFGPLVAQWQQILVFVAIASMVLGAFAAISQTNIKRLMAYSSIGHMGYALVGLAAGTEAGVRGVVIYIAIYMVMGIGTFACILAMRRQGRLVEGIQDLAGLAKTHPGMALALAVFMFSMAGIPPLAGFFGKLYVFLAAIEAGLYALAVIGVVASVVGAFYYLRIVKIMYFDEPVEAFDKRVDGDLVAVMTLTGVLTMFFFVYPMPLLQAAATAAKSLFAG